MIKNSPTIFISMSLDSIVSPLVHRLSSPVKKLFKLTDIWNLATNPNHKSLPLGMDNVSNSYATFLRMDNLPSFIQTMTTTSQVYR